MTKKRSSEILADENRKCLGEKVKLGKFSTEAEQFFWNRGEIWNRGKCIIVSGGWTPLYTCRCM